MENIYPIKRCRDAQPQNIQLHIYIKIIHLFSEEDVDSDRNIMSRDSLKTV